MGGDWQIREFEDAPLEIIDGDRGKNYPQTGDFRSLGYCLFLNAGNVTNKGFDFSACSFISKQKDEYLRKGKLRRHDIVLTTRGTVGNVAYYDDSIPYENIRINSGMIIFRPNPQEIFPGYLYLFLRSGLFSTQVKSLTTGSAQPQLPIRDINRIRLHLPSLPEQHAIAEVLGSLDDKIELNRRMNATLEELARALFKSWFVDFEPFRSGGMQSMAMGEIPEGWMIGTLADFADLNSETWSNKIAPTTIEYIDLSNTKWGVIEETVGYLWKDTPSRARRILRRGDTIIGTVRPGNGSYAFISEDGLTGSTGFAVLRPQKAVYREYIYLAATSKENIERFARLADGAAYPAIRPEIVVSTEIVVPPDDVLERFSEITKPNLDKIASNIEQSRTLAALRDALLPRLMSGEVRVKA
jgi:type I restriction enzyme S subunit